eukprot:Pgem_evm1s239
MIPRLRTHTSPNLPPLPVPKKGNEIATTNPATSHASETSKITTEKREKVKICYDKSKTNENNTITKNGSKNEKEVQRNENTNDDSDSEENKCSNDTCTTSRVLVKNAKSSRFPEFKSKLAALPSLPINEDLCDKHKGTSKTVTSPSFGTGSEFFYNTANETAVTVSNTTGMLDTENNCVCVKFDITNFQPPYQHDNNPVNTKKKKKKTQILKNSSLPKLNKFHSDDTAKLKRLSNSLAPGKLQLKRPPLPD